MIDINQGGFSMSKRSVLASLVAFFVVGVAASVWAAPQAKSYDVTGPIIELTDTMIIVQKGDDKWEIARDKDTKVTGELKVGAKVTIKYQMYAASVTVKEDKAAKEEKKEGKAK
jgi:hypothetical protein